MFQVTKANSVSGLGCGAKLSSFETISVFGQFFELKIKVVCSTD